MEGDDLLGQDGLEGDDLLGHDGLEGDDLLGQYGLEGDDLLPAGEGGGGGQEEEQGSQPGLQQEGTAQEEAGVALLDSFSPVHPSLCLFSFPYLCNIGLLFKVGVVRATIDSRMTISA